VSHFITLGLIVIAVYLFTRFSGNPLEHPAAYRNRRALNWVPLGIGYAFLYFGRYNLTVAKIALGGLMTKPEFGTIFAIGTWTYAVAFIINGPLTDRIGGRKAMLISVIGAAAANVLIGILVFALGPHGADSYLRTASGHTLLMVGFCVLYAVNMYFQSFGAVSIVKVNSAWFHVRERGVFGGIFGILISAGIFFAFDFGQWTVDALHRVKGAAGQLLTDAAGHVLINPPYWVFWVPGLLLLGAALWIFLMVRDRPGQAGYADFDTGDASSGEDDRPDPLPVILKKVVTNPIVLTIGAIEFCTGVLRQAIMHWYPIFAGEMGYKTSFFVTAEWGTMLFLAGATGGMTAGWISDKVFGSRRGPVAALLYGLMLVALIAMAFGLANMWVLGICVVLVSYCVIGTHGMLSGTATMDFGGRKNAGTAVGLIDGLVYLGTGLQALCLGFITQSDKGWSHGGYLSAAQRGWSIWPVFLLPFAVLGTVLAIRIWRAIPEAARKKPGAGGH